jgi:hypothetical protein
VTLFRPAPAHNPLKAPAICLCADCSRWVLDRRCPSRDPGGRQCGDYKGHRGSHNVIVATVFQIAQERAA